MHASSLTLENPNKTLLTLHQAHARNLFGALNGTLQGTASVTWGRAAAKAGGLPEETRSGKHKRQIGFLKRDPEGFYKGV